jgi:hypothetical protein
MNRTRTLVLVSLAALAAASVTACKPAANAADNTTAAANAPDTNAPVAATNDTNSMMGANTALPANSAASNSAK